MYLSESDHSESRETGSEASLPSISTDPHHALPHQAEPANPEASLPLAARIINSKSLFGESRIIHIEHRGMIYRMSITNQNRLILQK